MAAEEKELNLLVRNKISNRHKDHSGGIGLENVKKRLTLIYPGQHHIECIENGENFEVNLRLLREV
ncbi:MAG: hypothetical protein NVV59_16150 [Chitinophagaceae bacterium]|nr:hypothetical protein [Chitinophagaceae bacterium]